MTYAQVTADTITATQGRVPQAARRLDTGDWVLALRDAPVSLQEACGWFEVADVARPADTATTTFDRSFEMVATVATMIWTERNKTQTELDDEADQADRSAKGANITPAMIASLRTWASDAQGVNNINNGNRDTILKTTVNRLGIFFDRFADLVEAQRFETG